MDDSSQPPQDPDEQQLRDLERQQPRRLTPLEEAFARTAINEQIRAQKRAELQDAANLAWVSWATTHSTSETSVKVNDKALRRFVSLLRRDGKDWNEIKSSGSSRFPEIALLRHTAPDEWKAMWARVQDAERQANHRKAVNRDI